jgi:hypothetical protein
MVAGSKESWSLKSQELAHDHHAPRVTVMRESRWESQRLFLPCLANLNLFAHSQRSVLHYIRAISQEITYGKVLGGPVIEDFELTDKEPARNPRTGPEVKSGTKAGLKRKHLIRCNQDRLPASRMAREPRTRLDSREPALKPWLDSGIGKCKDDPGMSRRQSPWYTGAKFSKRVLKNFEKSRPTLCEPS